MAKRYPGVRTIKKGELYEISFYPRPGSKRKQFRVRAESEKEAFLLRTSYMSRGASSVSGRVTFSELKERLRLKCQADGNCQKTIVNLLGKFKTFFEEFLPKYYPEITDINQLKQAVFENYKQYVVVELKREHGWRDELTKIKSIFSKFVSIGVCRKEIYDDVLSQFKRPKRRIRTYREVSKAQMKTLLNYIKEDRPYFYGATYMMMRLGWRRGQVLSLKRRNIKLRKFRPIQIFCEPQDTKNKEPFILREIDDELAKVVHNALFAEIESEWLFPNKKGKKIHANNYTHYISKVSEEVLGIRLTPHSFRHNFCTQRLREGSIERDIMAVTGHKDPESFRIYVHATGEGTKKVVERSKLF